MLEVSIAEMDVHTLNTTLHTDIYSAVITEALDARITDISFWGFTDKYAYTWLEGAKPLMFDEYYNPKGAFYATHSDHPFFSSSILTAHHRCYHSSQSRLLSASPPARFSIPAFLSGRIHPPPILLSLDPSTVHNPVHSPQSTAPDLISTGLPVLPVSFKQRLILIFIFSITLS